MTCPNCGAPSNTDNLNKISLDIYCKCDYCQTNFLFRKVNPQQRQDVVVATNGGISIGGNCNGNIVISGSDNVVIRK